MADQTPEELAQIAQLANDPDKSITDAEVDRGDEGEIKPASLQETVEAIVQEHKDAEDDDARSDEKAEDPPTPESDPVKKDPDVTEEKKEPVAEEEPNKEPLTPKEKADLEASFQQSDRFREMEKSIKESEPLTTWAKNDFEFMQKNGISQEEWVQSRELLALSKTDPERFWKSIDTLKEQYEIQKGTRLPVDLQAKVDANECSLEVAKQAALLRIENQNLKNGAQRTEAQRLQDVAKEIHTVTDEWDNQKRKVDPDFTPKKAPTDPDGKYEIVAAIATQMAKDHATTSGLPSAVQMRAMLEAAYKKVDAYQKRLSPRTRVAPRKIPNNGSSITAAEGEPGSLREAVQAAIGKKHGIRLGSN